MLSVFLIGLSLALDAFAVSVSSGIAIPGLRIFHAIRASLFFGLFQFIMPLTGWYLGHVLNAIIRTYDHWIAFGLLVLIGGRMIREGLIARRVSDRSGTETDGGKKDRPPPDIRNLAALFGLAIATSID
ncbi:MAG: manganese efflux pump MntP family protein, partial [Spirochaetaceae bacterium]|nr:manganese efflux pump MntP family protein [Spirochaetaceae bacterium]